MNRISCFHRSESDITCVVGEHDKLFPDEGNPSRVYHSVQKIFRHEEYVGFENNYDKDIGWYF